MKKDQPNKEKQGRSDDQTVALNRRGRFNYQIEESLEVGLALTGTEVKSARRGNVQIAEAYARLEAGPGEGPEVWLYSMHIAPYEQGNMFNVDPRRKRKLLLHRRQIAKLASRVEQKGYTLVPLKMYFARGRAKLELGVGKGRKTHDKREAITDRETRRELARSGGAMRD